MEEINKPINTSSSFNLEKSLSPLWKSTYYLGLTFDWCRPIPKKSWLSIISRCFIIFATFVTLLYSTSSLALALIEVIRNSESMILVIVLEMTALSDQLIILVAYSYFVFNRRKLQAFFSDWKQIEEPLDIYKGFDPSKMKRTCIIIYTLYYIYTLCNLFTSIYAEVIGNDDGSGPSDIDGDLIASYYPELVSNSFYISLVKFQNAFLEFLTVVFCPLIDIAPLMVYYHAARIVDGMTSEIQDDSSPSNSTKSEVVYSLWSRFEALTVMVRRTDKLFGPMVILCHGYLFTMICGLIYCFMKLTLDCRIGEVFLSVPLFFLFWTIFLPIRLLLSIFLVSKLEGSTAALISATALHFNKRLHRLEKEEQKIVRYFLDRLNQIKLAACPAGLYKIKPSINLTMLSLIVTYTIILLQSNVNEENNA